MTRFLSMKILMQCKRSLSTFEKHPVYFQTSNRLKKLQKINTYRNFINKINSMRAIFSKYFLDSFDRLDVAVNM